MERSLEMIRNSKDPGKALEISLSTISDNLKEETK